MAVGLSKEWQNISILSIGLFLWLNEISFAHAPNTHIFEARSKDEPAQTLGTEIGEATSTMAIARGVEPDYLAA